jgi:hypothetical protein
MFPTSNRSAPTLPAGFIRAIADANLLDRRGHVGQAAGDPTRKPPCTIDGEAVACDDDGAPSFDLFQRRRRDDQVFLYAGGDCPPRSVP